MIDINTPTKPPYDIIQALEQGHFVFCLPLSTSDAPIALSKQDHVLYSFVALCESDRLVLHLSGAQEYSRHTIHAIYNQLLPAYSDIRIDLQDALRRDDIATGSWTHARIMAALEQSPVLRLLPIPK